MNSRPRMPDPVRDAAVRAVLIIALTMVQLVVVLLTTLAGSWLAFPMLVSTLVSSVLATWGVLDIWITRQMWRQRNGVVSLPSSAARQRTSPVSPPRSISGLGEPTGRPARTRGDAR